MLTDSDYYWSTEESHGNNQATMCDFLDNHLTDDYEVVMVDGTYAEIKNIGTGDVFEVHASGDGDFNNHKVRFEPLNDGT